MGAATGAIVAAASRRAERRIVERLQESGATSFAKAQLLSGLRRMERQRLRRMLAAGAIREASPGTYYLDESALGAYRQHRRGRVLVVLGAVLLALLGLFGINRK